MQGAIKVLLMLLYMNSISDVVILRYYSIIDVVVYSIIDVVISISINFHGHQKLTKKKIQVV